MLVHGWESNAARWEPFLPHLLESGFSVVAVDAPGHGLSSGNELNLPFYADVISECIKLFNPSFLIGHSIGGAASLLSQHVSPASGLKKMVLLGAPSDMSIILNNFQNILGLNQRSRSLLQQYFIDRFGKGVEAYTASLYCQNISVPTLVAHDQDDEVVLYDEAVKITRAWPHARLVTTRGLGHSMHDDGLYREVVNFLK